MIVIAAIASLINSDAGLHDRDAVARDTEQGLGTVEDGPQLFENAEVVENDTKHT